MVDIFKIIKKVKASCGWKKTVIFRAKTGLQCMEDSHSTGDSSVEHIVYENQGVLSSEDIVGIQAIVGEDVKTIIKWLARPRYRLIVLKSEGKIVHFGMVLVCKNGDFYGMADKDDLMIMSCNTLPEQQRKGFYSCNLKYIYKNWKRNSTAFVSTRLKNIASQKGIEAAGFERVGTYRYFRFLRLTLFLRKCGD